MTACNTDQGLRTELGSPPAYSILAAARGEDAADAIWNGRSPAERAEASAFAEEHFGPIMRDLAKRLTAWEGE